MRLTGSNLKSTCRLPCTVLPHEVTAEVAQFRRRTGPAAASFSAAQNSHQLLTCRSLSRFFVECKKRFHVVVNHVLGRVVRIGVDCV